MLNLPGVECAGNLFLADSRLLDISAFEEYFHPDKTYIYEVFRVIKGIPLFIEDHLDRFYHTLQLSGSNFSPSGEQLLSDIERLIRNTGIRQGNIKICITPGINSESHLLIYFTPHQYPEPEDFIYGVSVGLIYAERLNPNAKVMDLILRKDLDLKKKTGEFYEVLLIDRDGYVTEGSRSNVFFISGNEIVTPPLISVLPGVTRKKVIDLCTENSIILTERKIHVSEIDSFNALFITGTSRKVLPVRKVADIVFSTDNELLTKMILLFNQCVESYLESHRQD